MVRFAVPTRSVYTVGWLRRKRFSPPVWLPSDSVLKVPSRNVLLTESPWKGEQPRTTTNDTTRARPAGGAEESRQKASHPEAGRPAVGPQRTADPAAAGQAAQRRRPRRDPCRARPRLQPQDQRPGRKTSRHDPLPTRIRRLWADPGSGIPRAAPRHPRRPRNAAGLDDRGRAVEAAPTQGSTPALVAAKAQSPRRACAVGHLRARLAGGPRRREAVPDRDDRRRQQRVAGALCAARLERREPPFAADLSGEKTAVPWRSTPTAPACL